MKTNDKKTKNIIRLNLSKCDMNFLNALSKIPFIRETPGMMQTLAEELKSRFDEAGVEGCIANVIPYISDELMKPFIGHGADEAIAQHCKDSQMLLELLRSCKSNLCVVANIAANEHTDEDTIRILVNEFYYITSIYYGLLKRHDLPLDVLETIACHPDERVKVQLAEYKEAPAEILALLLELSESRNVRLKIAKHPNATADILRSVLHSEKQEDFPNEEVFKAISEHKDIMTDDILLELLNFWRDDHRMITWVLKGSNASEDVLAYVYKDIQAYTSLLDYDKTPVEILEQILQLEDGSDYAERLGSHSNSNEQLLMDVVRKFGTNPRVLLSVIYNQNATKKIFDYIIFEVVDELPWDCCNGYNREDVRRIICKERCRLVEF